MNKIALFLIAFSLSVKSNDCLDVLNKVNNKLFPFFVNVTSFKCQAYSNSFENISDYLIDFDSALIKKSNIKNIHVLINYNSNNRLTVLTNNIKFTGNKKYDSVMCDAIDEFILPIRIAIYHFSILIQRNNLDKFISNTKIDTLQGSYSLTYADYKYREWIMMLVDSNYIIKNIKISPYDSGYTEVIPGFINKNKYFLPSDIDIAINSYYWKFVFGYDDCNLSFPSHLFFRFEHKNIKYDEMVHFSKATITYKKGKQISKTD